MHLHKCEQNVKKSQLSEICSLPLAADIQLSAVTPFSCWTHTKDQFMHTSLFHLIGLSVITHYSPCVTICEYVSSLAKHIF